MRSGDDAETNPLWRVGRISTARCRPAIGAPCSLPGAGFVDRLVDHGKMRMQR
jgi:hypothetical protein